MKILVSACLLGTACRYDGQSKPHPLMEELCRRHQVVPVCGEIMGGLATPRVPAERRGERSVITREGGDVTEAYWRGAREVLRLGQLLDCHVAILKERSPSCGSGKIYDGTFTGTVTDGWGVTAQLLRDNGFRVLGESDLPAFLEEDDGAADVLQVRTAEDTASANSVEA